VEECGFLICGSGFSPFRSAARSLLSDCIDFLKAEKNDQKVDALFFLKVLDFFWEGPELSVQPNERIESWHKYRAFKKLRPAERHIHSRSAFLCI
jgi:hypothetical protein